MRLFDSHAHFNDVAFQEDRDAVIQRCFDSGVEKTVVIGYSEHTSEEALAIAKQYDGLYATVGAHPDECNGEIDLSFVSKLAKDEKVVAIGEIGLDYHYETTRKEPQAKYFIEQIKIANELGLPVSIHSRDADMDMLKILKENPIEKGFVMHCFSSSSEIAKEVLKLGGYISLAGTVTFKNARGLLEVAKMVPQDKLLIETDSPYLAPEPFRGTRNDPSLIINTARKIADLRETTLEEIAEATYQNAMKFYGIK
ncbi:MAG: TatD family hydrolase [Clostridia bacterium]|nr:TatD family hydrolase [Clostridia bacterium]